MHAIRAIEGIGSHTLDICDRLTKTIVEGKIVILCIN